MIFEYLVNESGEITARNVDPNVTGVVISPPLDIIIKTIGEFTFCKYKWTGTVAGERVPNIYAVINPDRLNVVESLAVTFQTSVNINFIPIAFFTPLIIGTQRYDGTALVNLTTINIADIAEIDAKKVSLTMSTFRELLSVSEKENIDDFEGSTLSTGDKKTIRTFLQDLNTFSEFLIDDPIISTGISDLESTTLIVAGRSDEIANLEPEGKPIIKPDSAKLSADNTFIDFSFNKGVCRADLTNPIVAADISLAFNQNGGAATAVTISSLKQQDNDVEGNASALVGGEKLIRAFLSITGTPNGLENIEIAPVVTSVYGKAGNAAETVDTTGVVLLLDVAGLEPIILSSSLDPENRFFDITYNIGIYKSDGVTPVGVTEFGGQFNQNGGDLTGFSFSSIKQPDSVIEDSASALAGGEKTVRVFIAQPLAQDPTGVETGLMQNLTAGIASPYGVTNSVLLSTVLHNFTPFVRPRILNGVLAANNTYIDIFFSEGIYASNGVSPVFNPNFGLLFSQNGGGKTSLNLSSVKQNDSEIESNASTPVGGETVIRLFVSGAGTATGVETISVQATPVFNDVLVSSGLSPEQTTGALRLFPE